MNDSIDHQKITKRTRKQAYLLILIFIFVIALLQLFKYPNLYKDVLAIFEKNTSTCDDNNVNQAPPAIPHFAWQETGLITLWFDDGWKTQYTTAFPEMQNAGFKGAVAVAVDFVCRPAFVTWNQLRTMQAQGWETTAHSITHTCKLEYYTDATTKQELLGSKQAIIAHGLRADHFVMPCGYSRAQIKAAFVGQHPPIVETAQQYFDSYRTTESERINALPLLDPYNLNAFQMRDTTTDQEITNVINQAVTQKGWLIIVVHQIDETHRPLSITLDKFKLVLDLVKKSGLPVVLPSQVIENRATNTMFKKAP